MAFWNKLFGKKKNNPSNQQKEQQNQYQLKWVPPHQNPWNIPLLDLRPITRAM